MAGGLGFGSGYNAGNANGGVSNKSVDRTSGKLGGNKQSFSGPKGKTTEGDPRAYDKALKKLNAADIAPLTDVQKAVLESARQRKMQGTGLDIAQTIMGAMPAPALGAVFGAGRWMGEESEKEALTRPGDFSTDPTDPGSVFSKPGTGAKYSNRAEFPGHSLTTQDKRGAQDLASKGTLGGDPLEDKRKKKNTSATPTTILGANPIDTLGTSIQRIS
jgi:hypothetical protein